jgi:hypothetical protein
MPLHMKIRPVGRDMILMFYLGCLSSEKENNKTASISLGSSLPYSSNVNPVSGEC